MMFSPKMKKSNTKLKASKKKVSFQQAQVKEAQLTA
jgi:hypothetical protein